MAAVDISALDPEGTVVVATGNAHKVIEIEAILSSVMPDARFVALGELGDFPDPVEDGDTFAKNALIKARAATRRDGTAMAVADDSGLCVDALGGAPGVFSARWAGEHGNDVCKQQQAQSRPWRACPRQTVPHASTRAWPSWVVTTMARRCSAAMATAREGSASSVVARAGLAMTRCSFPDDTPGRTMAELTLDEKNMISHRFHALDDLAGKLG